MKNFIDGSSLWLVCSSPASWGASNVAGVRWFQSLCPFAEPDCESGCALPLSEAWEPLNVGLGLLSLFKLDAEEVLDSGILNLECLGVGNAMEGSGGSGRL